MKRYYRTVKELRLLNEILLQHYEEENLGPRTAKVEPIDRRFRAYNGYLETTDKKIFERYPFAMLELFLVLNQRPELKGVRAGTIRQLRANLHRINQSFRDDIRARSLFMEIMRFPFGQTRALRRMNNYGVLGAYIPAFGSIVGQMQHDLFHVYTVDAHSLFVIRNLRRFKIPEYSNEFPLASELITRLFKPERLFLAGLFHDIAKGRGGDHSELGEQDAYAFCKRHDMSEYDARFVAWLVRNHLSMSYTAQRLDISDPAVINEFASKVGDPEHLNNLYLLTVADIRGTSPHVWNAWKGRLLEQLHAATTRALRLGQVTPDAVDARIEDIKHEALALVNPKVASPDVVRQYWSNMPQDYFLRHNARELAWHIEHIAATSALQLPLVVVRPDPDIDANSILVYAPDVEPLLTVVTAALAKQHLNVAEARLHVTPGGFALYTFVALTSDADTLGRQDPASLQQRLRESMLAGESHIELPQPRISRTLKHFPINTRVTFSDGSKHYTAMEVVAQDQPGLLHRVAKCLWQCKVRLVTAKIATYGARAEDVFFITDRDGDPVSDAAQLRCLSESIQVALVSDTVTESQPKAASA